MSTSAAPKARSFAALRHPGFRAFIVTYKREVPDSPVLLALVRCVGTIELAADLARIIPANERSGR